MMRVLILADDLTGALDSACAFAGRGLRTQVALTLPALRLALADHGLQVIAHVSGTRELSSAASLAATEEILTEVRGFDGIVFKKIDSRLKGHVAMELAALLMCFSRPVLASPAIPALGRYVVGGAVTGEGIDQPIPIAAALGCPARVPQILSDDDLDRALSPDLASNLYVGAAGLAAAIARRLAPAGMLAQPDLPLPLLLAVGSRDPVTLAQIAFAGLVPVAAPNGAVPPVAPNPVMMVQLTKGAETLSGIDASTAFASGIIDEFRRTAPRSLFISGGETAHAILRRLGISMLDLQGEVLPGVPVARCPRTGLTVLTKSGGFGARELIATLLNKFAKSG